MKLQDKYSEDKMTDFVIAPILQQPQSVTKIMGKFFVSLPFLPLRMLRLNEQNLRQARLWVCNIVKGETGDT